MPLKDISFPTSQENIDFDDVLLKLADKTELAIEYLRFWESSTYFIVLGHQPCDCVGAFSHHARVGG